MINCKNLKHRMKRTNKYLKYKQNKLSKNIEWLKHSTIVPAKKLKVRGIR